MGLLTGQVAITGSAQALTTIVRETDQVVIKAPLTNLNPVYLGTSGVTTVTGHILEPSESFIINNDMRSGEVTYDLDPHEVFVVGTAGSDKVTWVAWVR